MTPGVLPIPANRAKPNPVLLDGVWRLMVEAAQQVLRGDLGQNTWQSRGRRAQEDSGQVKPTQNLTGTRLHAMPGSFRDMALSAER